MLMRVFGAIERGYYIDVGAQHPRIDSVSRSFYEKGWRGLHIEPVPSYVERLRADRPDEPVIQAVLGENKRKVRFYEIAETGLSTVSESIAREHAARGFEITETIVEQTTLSSVFDLIGPRVIHWLKIDVEGYELSVLRGWRHPARPWVLVVESTLPLSQTPSYEQWEPYLLRRGYRFVYFDGLNRFYLHRDHLMLQKEFKYGPCVFDDFVHSGLSTSSFAKLRP